MPVAGTLKSFGISMIMSGLMFHPSWKATAAGLSFASPSGAPLSAQSVSVLMSASLSRRVVREVAVIGIRKPGRHLPAHTCVLMDFAHGRVLS